MTFTQKLTEAVRETDSYLCTGLDPNLERVPKIIKKQYSQPDEQVFHFLKRVIEITSPHCAAFKPNMAFFEALGGVGLEVFEEVIKCIPDQKIIIADAKRGDISTTAEHYARAYFEEFNVDALTLNPLMGFETLEPFLEYPEKGIFVLTLASNPGAADFLMKPFAEQASMAAYIAQKCVSINNPNAAHVGMVVGATKPYKIKSVIRHHPGAALLIPGMGAQGGSISEFKKVLEAHQGISLFNSSRSILYAGEQANDWGKAVEKQTTELKSQLNSIFKADA